MSASTSATRALPLALAFGLVLSASIAAAAMVHVPQSAPREIVLTQARPNLNTQAQIYLLRGLANVFSRGMDEMAATLTSHGFSPQVINHRGAQTAVDTITRNYRGGQRAPVILIGHSLGANAALRMAKSLQRNGIPVAYLATFDPTNALAVPNNVDTFVNFYQSRLGRAATFPPSRHQSKVNLNLTTSPGITHTNIDQTPRLQRIVIDRILQITAR